MVQIWTIPIDESARATYSLVQEGTVTALASPPDVVVLARKIRDSMAPSAERLWALIVPLAVSSRARAVAQRVRPSGVTATSSDQKAEEF